MGQGFGAARARRLSEAQLKLLVAHAGGPVPIALAGHANVTRRILIDLGMIVACCSVSSGRGRPPARPRLTRLSPLGAEVLRAALHDSLVVPIIVGTPTIVPDVNAGEVREEVSGSGEGIRGVAADA